MENDDITNNKNLELVDLDAPRQDEKDDGGFAYGGPNDDTDLIIDDSVKRSWKRFARNLDHVRIDKDTMVDMLTGHYMVFKFLLSEIGDIKGRLSLEERKRLYRTCLELIMHLSSGSKRGVRLFTACSPMMQYMMPMALELSESDRDDVVNGFGSDVIGTREAGVFSTRDTDHVSHNLTDLINSLPDDVNIRRTVLSDLKRAIGDESRVPRDARDQLISMIDVELKKIGD